ncbi:hypothetical protein QQ045_031640 [Rhodiola kirilowii]
MDEIHRAFISVWGLDASTTIGALDARHILIIHLSGGDVNKVLAHPMRKVGQSMFRMFRWSLDFHTRKETMTTTAWVWLLGLPLEVFDKAYIVAIVSSIGRFLAIDERTQTYSNPIYAWACIEIDLSKLLPSELSNNIVGDRTIIQPVVFEGKLLYCSKCKIHGHQLSSCRKVKVPTSEITKSGEPRQISGFPRQLGPGNQRGQDSISKQSVGIEQSVREDLVPIESFPNIVLWNLVVRGNKLEIQADRNSPRNNANHGVMSSGTRGVSSDTTYHPLPMEGSHESFALDSQSEGDEAHTPTTSNREDSIPSGKDFQAFKALS